MLKGVIAADVLMEMPLPFVHRLRDIRIKQREAQRIEAEKSAQMNGINSIDNQQPNLPPIDVSAIEEAIEEQL